MSTFSGLTTALSSLIAQRQALDVAGQNIANANTAGYTRQRTTLQSVESLSTPTLHSSPLGAGTGVKVVGIDRIGDSFLDARVRSETSSAALQTAHAQTLSRLQSTLTEPADTGVASSLQDFWAAWEDVGNRPDDDAARQVLLGQADALVAKVSGGYRAVETQWSQLRTETQTLTTEVNTTADQVADLNERIRSILVTGGSANELMDRRDLLVTSLSSLVGAEARPREDGTLDVMVGGNALVRGVTSNAVVVQGSYTMLGAATDPVRLAWADSPATPLTPTGGRLAAHLSNLSSGGALQGAAAMWNGLATKLADTVNGLHTTGVGLDGTAGRAFFALGAGPAAVGLSVAVTDPDHVAAAAAGKGALDGSLADRLAQQSTAADGPDLHWRDFVVGLGVRVRAADQRATVSEAARATAQNLQLSTASVDLDEETVSMLASQRAYEGAARVLTAVDEMLDVLINRTGLVGR